MLDISACAVVDGASLGPSDVSRVVGSAVVASPVAGSETSPTEVTSWVDGAVVSSVGNTVLGCSDGAALDSAVGSLGASVDASVDRLAVVSSCAVEGTVLDATGDSVVSSSVLDG